MQLEQEPQEASDDAQMIDNISNVLDIIRSDAFSAQQKNAALKSIVDRIVFDRERMHIDVDYYLAETPETLDL